jgi:hypothetical protein
MSRENNRRRDLDAVFNRLPISDADIEKRIRRGIGYRLISYRPQATWALGFSLVESPKDKLTRFESEALELIDKHNLTQALCSVDTVANYSPYSCLILGINDTEDLSQPISHDAGHKLLWVKVADAKQCRIKKKEDNFLSERFGQPISYQLNHPDFSKRVASNVVHYSRVIHYNPNSLTSTTEGIPLITAIYDYIEDIDKISFSYAETFFRQAKALLIAVLDENKEYTKEQKTEIKEQLLAIQEGLKSHVLVQGFKLEFERPSVTEPGNGIDQIMRLMLAIAAIPWRKFFGVEEGVKASDQDAKMDEESSQRRRLLYATRLVKDLFGRLFEIGVIGAPRRKTYNVVFDAEHSLGLEVKVKILKELATANRINGETLLTTEQILDYAGLNPASELQEEDREDKDE